MFSKCKLSSAIVTALSVLACQSLAAQEALNQAEGAAGESEKIEEVVVYGSYRKSLEKALDLKRENISFSDSIVATDIADFPDQNLAEALQRIPGVAIERDKGLGTKVNVRSLGTGFTHTTINNVSTSSGSGGRDVNFDIFASELIQSVTVKKSPLASDEEGGVAGVVSIETARPFDYDGMKVVVTGKQSYNTLSEEKDPGYSFLFSNTFNDQWGVLVSYAREDRKNRTDDAGTAEFRPLSALVEDAYDITYEDAIEAGATETAAVAAAEAARDSALPAGVSPDVVYAENVRDHITLNAQEKWGATVALQFRPTDDLALNLDIMQGNFYSKEDDYLFGSWTGNATKATDLTIDSRGVVTKGTFENAQHEYKSYDRYRDEDYSQLSLSADWRVADWNVDGLIGYSGAERSYQRTQAKWINYASLTQEYTDNGMVRSSNDFDLATDLSGYTFKFWDFDNTKVEDEKFVYQLDFQKDLMLRSLPFVSSVQFGARYSEKSMKYDHGWTEVQGETIIPGEGGRQETSQEWVGMPLPVDAVVPVNSLIPGDNYMSEIPGKFDGWLVVPNAWARANYYIDGLQPNYFFNDHYQVDEDVLGLYAMTDLAFDIGPFPTTLNLGVRYVSTEQTSYGYQQVDGVWSDSPVKFSADYTDTLPSMNMAVELRDDVVLRMAAAKVMTRAALSQLSGKRDISTNDKVINMGNPDLEPLRASQADLALEWYFDREALFSVTAFYKDLESFITKAQTGTTPYNGEIYDVRTYINAKGSIIKGSEVILQMPFTFLPKAFEGFGINANYTYVDSSEGHVSDIGLKVPMFGLSKDSYNATLYYENYGFDARISYNYKGKSVQELEDNLYAIYREGYGQFDISAGYAINENLKVTFEAINVTDEHQKEYQVDPAYPYNLQVSGSRYSLGLRASF